MKGIIKAWKINVFFSSRLPALSHRFAEHRWIFRFLNRADLSGRVWKHGGSAVKLRCSLFNLISAVLDDKELRQIIPAGSCSE